MGSFRLCVSTCEDCEQIKRREATHWHTQARARTPLLLYLQFWSIVVRSSPLCQGRKKHYTRKVLYLVSVAFCPTHVLSVKWLPKSWSVRPHYLRFCPVWRSNQVLLF